MVCSFMVRNQFAGGVLWGGLSRLGAQRLRSSFAGGCCQPGGGGGVCGTCWLGGGGGGVHCGFTG